MAGMDYSQIVFNNGKHWVDKTGWTKDITSDYRVFIIGKYGDIERIVSKSNINDLSKRSLFRKYRLNHRVDFEQYSVGSNDELYENVRPQREVFYGEYEHIKYYEIDYNMEGYRCFFMWDDFGNHYAWVGGYGHHGNPYLHFYQRGYGKEFEKQMVAECYNWLMTTVLNDLADIMWGTPFHCDNYEEEDYIEEQSFEWVENFKQRIRAEYNFKED